MAKYEQYAEYKDSGVEWLGEIPKDWEAIRVKYIADAVSTGGTPKELSSFTLDPEVCWFSPVDFHYGQVLRQANKYVTWKSINVNDSKIYKENSVLVIGIGATLGKVAHCSTPFSCNQQINVITPNRNISSFFLMYSLLVQNEQMSISSNASTIGIMNQEKTKDIFLALPSLEEQKAVTNFLDYETAQIDTLIKKQQTLIKLLKEKRQAVISHAVTKGLNPDAPMKDSGVEWLGDVPEHWGVGRLKNVLRIRNGKDYKAVEVESGGYPVYGSGGIFKRSSDYLFDGESVLFGRKGTIDKPLLVSGRFWTVDTMFYSEVSNNAKPDYIYHQALLFPFDKLSTNTALPSMTQEDLLSLGFVIPPFSEQEEICQYLYNKLKVFSNLVSKAEQAIQLMQERRIALISAAVTGKIDVRGWQVPDDNV